MKDVKALPESMLFNHVAYAWAGPPWNVVGMLSPWSWLAEITVEELGEALLDAVRWRLRERVLGPFGEDSAEVGLRAALGDAGNPPAGESCRSMERRSSTANF